MLRLYFFLFHLLFQLLFALGLLAAELRLSWLFASLFLQLLFLYFFLNFAATSTASLSTFIVAIKKSICLLNPGILFNFVKNNSNTTSPIPKPIPGHDSPPKISTRLS